jgi:hypothetical protein
MFFRRGQTGAAGRFGWFPEVMVITAAAPVLGSLVNPSDPYMLHSPFPWLMLAPLAVALQHGLWAGLTSSVVLSGLAGWQALSSGPIPASFASWSIGCGLTAMIAGQIRDSVRGRAEKLAQRAETLEDRLERSERTRHLIQLSHAKLEERVAAQRSSLAGAIEDAERRMAVAHSMHELGQVLLDVVAAQGHLHAATLYIAARDHGILLSEPVASFGGTGASSARHALVVRAFKTGKLAAIVDAVEAARTDTSVLAAVPLITARRRTVGVVAVHQMPFMMFHADHLNQVFVLAGHLADLLIDRWSVVHAVPQLSVDERRAIQRRVTIPAVKADAILQLVAATETRRLAVDASQRATLVSEPTVIVAAAEPEVLDITVVDEEQVEAEVQPQAEARSENSVVGIFEPGRGTATQTRRFAALMEFAPVRVSAPVSVGDAVTAVAPVEVVEAVRDAESIQLMHKSVTPTLPSFGAVVPPEVTEPVSVAGASELSESTQAAGQPMSVPAKFEQTLAALAAIEESGGERAASRKDAESAAETKEVHAVSDAKATQSGIEPVLEAVVQPTAAETTPESAATVAENEKSAPGTAKQRTRAERLAALEAARAAAVEAVRARTARPGVETEAASKAETLRPARPTSIRMRTNAKAKPPARTSAATITASGTAAAQATPSTAAELETRAAAAATRAVAQAESVGFAQAESVGFAPTAVVTASFEESAPAAQGASPARAQARNAVSARSVKANEYARLTAHAENSAKLFERAESTAYVESANGANESMLAGSHAATRTILPPPPTDPLSIFVAAHDSADVATNAAHDHQAFATVAEGTAHSNADSAAEAASTAPAARESVRPSLPPQVENARSAILAAFARKANEDDTSSRPTVRPSFRIARVALSHPKPQQIVESIAPSAIKSEPAPAPKTIEPEPVVILPPAKASDARASVRAAFKNRGDASTVFATEGANADRTATRGDESTVIQTGSNATAETVRPSARAAKRGATSDAARGVQRTSATSAAVARADDGTTVSNSACTPAGATGATPTGNAAARSDANPTTDDRRASAHTSDDSSVSDAARTAARASEATLSSEATPTTARTDAPDPSRVAQAREAMLATLAKARSLVPNKSRKAPRATEPTTETRARSQATRAHEDAPAARSSSI